MGGDIRPHDEEDEVDAIDSTEDAGASLLLLSLRRYSPSDTGAWNENGPASMFSMISTTLGFHDCVDVCVCVCVCVKLSKGGNYLL